MEPGGTARCSRWAPGIKCASRREAQARGEMFYSYAHGGWLYPAEDRMVPKLLRDEKRQPYKWLTCPFCGGALPDFADALPAIMSEEDGN